MDYNEAQYWARVQKGDQDACWLWTDRVSVDGYGVMGKKTKATHVALILDGRPRPTGLQANHTCDTPACCNPRHLYWGTQQENIADMVARGRYPRRDGEHNARARLTAAQVVGLREDYENGATVTALLSRYPVAKGSLHQILTGRKWAKVGGPIQPVLRRGQLRRPRVGYRDKIVSVGHDARFDELVALGREIEQEADW